MDAHGAASDRQGTPGGGRRRARRGQDQGLRRGSRRRVLPLRAGCNTPTDYLLWASHDGGRHWTRRSIGVGHTAFTIKAYDDRTAAAIVYDLHPNGPCSSIGDRNAVYVTQDGGSTWRRALACPKGHLCTSAVFVAPGKLLVGRNEGSTAVSTDGGRSFRPGPNFRNGLPPAQDSAQWFWVQGVAFANPRRGWLSVKGVGTYVTSDGGAHWDLEHSQDETFGLDVGDATAADVEHALIAGPTTVSTRLPLAPPQVLPSGITGTPIAPPRAALDHTGVVRIRGLRG